MELTTERLYLNSFEQSDKNKLVELLNEPRIAATTAGIPYPFEMKDAEAFLEKSESTKEQGHINFAIRFKDNGELIGCIALYTELSHNRAMVGFWLTPIFWNKGIMSEALIRVIDYGLNVMKLNRIEGHHLAGNDASAKVMLKSGMLLEGIFKARVVKDGLVFDTHHYGIIK